MYDSFDQKGKIFTNVITKEPVQVIVQTITNTIQGEIHVRINQRLKDELNSDDQFLAITDATIYDSGGNLLYQSHFIAVNRSHILWLIPNKELIDKQEEQ